MKFNDREIIVKGYSPPDIEGVLHYLRPQSNDWSTWYSAPSFKERKFKLVSNLLFYYRVGELEPLGLLVIENVTVKHEKPLNGVVFPFSIEFGDELQRKYIFSCRCQEEANSWVKKLNCASYEYWRTQLVILQKKISMRTGKEPTKIYPGNQGIAENLDWTKDKKVVASKTSFRCHLNEGSSTNPFVDAQQISLQELNISANNHNNRSDPPVEDLIKF